ncbi:uncharacterized protein EDB91DRAFT_1061907 [Suillus paluster]|uniref:uncharacterized protein n=1 Tax=Suillus paluster TaxID=48578 RepID=UPI001B883225|nr:uncharacterized protein EDB91DRAFT_1061907 [Suillus paluster]KAG1726002.1 hypothetical protein EDB91DRAFT_1061907 [Suillus paluster]
MSSLLVHVALTDSDSIIPNAKSTETVTDFYNRGLMTRRYALAGVACSSIVSCCCIVTGTVIIISTHKISGTIQVISPITNLQSEMLSLTLSFIVTLCTESIGLMHNISLRSALASESRLIFSTNLRLMTAAHGWCNPNGVLLNGLMAVLLIISYASASLAQESGFIVGFPLLVLGIALFLQVIITLAGMRAVKILTWSSSPFDLTAALLHHTQLTPASFQCMRSVSDLDIAEGPAKPSEAQPSAWHSHPRIQKVVVSLWGIVVACAGWAVLVRYKYTLSPSSSSSKWWSFFTDFNSSYAVGYIVAKKDDTISFQLWILVFVNIAVVQGPLTLGLHCAELIANVIQNERQWRCATARKGLHTVTNPLKLFLINPLGLFLFVVKPVLHWMFGYAFHFGFWTAFAIASGGNNAFAVGDFVIWTLCIALFIFACIFTFSALRRPRGPQPAAYGHLQTLANLVDEWSPVMWWGHKEDGLLYCHAGRDFSVLRGSSIDALKKGRAIIRCWM